MSADNAIVILKLTLKSNPEDCSATYAYYVAHMQATEDLTDENPDVVWGVFGKCKRFLRESDALKLAGEMAADYPILEYGIISVSLPRTMEEYREDAKIVLLQEIIDISDGKTGWSDIALVALERIKELAQTLMEIENGKEFLGKITD